jgi:NADPH-dependent ferric siderophore reductase
VTAALAGSRARTVHYPRRLRTLSVLGTAPVGSGLLRVALGGPGLAGFESHTVDEHVKLLFPDSPDQLPQQRGDDLAWPTPRPPSRDYSVRRVTAEALEVDVVLHGSGLASDWARAAQPGDQIHLVGPPSGLVVPDRYARLLLAGDLSASPVVARWLEALPPTAAGWALIEVGSAAEEFPLAAPSGMDVRFVRRAGSPGTGDALEQAVRACPVSAEDFVWIAGEAGQIRPLRRWARQELGLPRSSASVSGYWKRGTAGFEEDSNPAA